MSSSHPRSPRSLRAAGLLSLFCAGFALALSTQPVAQCPPQWLPGLGVSGTNDYVNAITTWDPDGAGPTQPLVVIGGRFTLVGATLANRIAAYVPQTGTWLPLGSGLNGDVVSLLALPTGELIAGGEFTTAGGLSAKSVAKWDGSSWAPLGTGLANSPGFPSVAYALERLPNGDIVAGGYFTTAGGNPASSIARWDGSAWSELGGGVSWAFPGQPTVGALEVMPNGDLFAGGSFSSAGGVATGGIARWNGVAWSPVGAGLSFGPEDLLAAPNGDLIAGGIFTTAGGAPAPCIARWNGLSWASLGGGMANGAQVAYVADLALAANGDVLACGTFSTAGGLNAKNVARWNGSTWSALGTGVNQAAHAIGEVPGGDLFVGGTFALAGGSASNCFSRWNGSNWIALGSGVDGPVFSLDARPDGTLVVGGFFSSAGGIGAASIVAWNGASWSAFGPGMIGNVRALGSLSNGQLVAGGAFFVLGSGSFAGYLVRWNGSSWSPLGGGLNDTLYAMTRLPSGDLVAGGDFLNAGGVAVNRIARWNGTSWSTLGTGMNFTVRALATAPNGDLIAGGGFSSAGGVAVQRIARWNGSTWSPIGTGLNGMVHALLALPDGSIVAGGDFTQAGGQPASRIALWNGTNWSALGGGMNGTVHALAQLPNGDIVAGGAFTTADGAPADRIARWNGSQWSALGAGLNGTVHALEQRANGELVVGGEFTAANGSVSAHFARYAASCPATAVQTGNGCLGATLQAVSLPWIGSNYQIQGSALPPATIVVVATGFAPLSIPLSSIVAQAAAGCDVLLSPALEYTKLAVPAGGVAQSSNFLPNDVGLAGIGFYQQMVTLSLDGFGAITAAASTNALHATIGSL